MRNLLYAAALALMMASAAGAETRNVLIFVADDMGRDAGCYGNADVKTPHIDRLAAEGTRFDFAYCTTASCSASRSVILTGMYNHATGQFGHAHAFHGFQTRTTFRGLPVLLGEAGYRSTSIGKLHVLPESVYRFDNYAQKIGDGTAGGRSPTDLAEATRQFIAGAGDKPFVAYVCTSDPHRDFGNRGRYAGVEVVRYDPAAIKVPAWLPDRAETRAELAEYYQAISRVDQTLGKLLSVLDETGHGDDTLVMFLSDNGAPFCGAKTTLYEPGARLPLVVRSPKQSRRGVVSKALVTWVDLVPTILEWTGAKGPAYPLHGRSLLPILDAEEPTGWDEAYLSHTFHEVTMYYPMRAIRTRTHKYILNLAHELPFPLAGDLFPSPTWQAALREPQAKYGRRSIEQYLRRPRHELYDLAVDPDETANLAEEPTASQILAEFQARLRAWQERTADPWIVKYRHE